MSKFNDFTTFVLFPARPEDGEFESNKVERVEVFVHLNDDGRIGRVYTWEDSYVPPYVIGPSYAGLTAGGYAPVVDLPQAFIDDHEASILADIQDALADLD
jgi:hypothetical protein